MMLPSNRVRVLVSTQPIDFRKGHDGLAALVLRPSPKIQPRIFIAVSISNTCSSSVPKAHGR
jgi:hypothetical protein